MIDHLWSKYRSYITQAIEGNIDVKDISYWRNKLFAECLIYLFPFCLIAVIPGVYWSFKTGIPNLGIIQILVVLLIAASIFIKLSINSKKLIFIAAIYFISTVLIYYLGSLGPGLI